MLLRPPHELRNTPPGFALAWSLTLMALGGCTVGPTYTRPASPVPENWSLPKETRLDPRSSADVQWWREFDDPALDRLIEVAWKQNLPLQVAGVRIAEARAQLGIAWARQYPQFAALSGEVQVQRINGNLANVANLGQTFLTYQVAVDVAWEVDLWGKYRRGIEAQEDLLRASVADHEGALVSLTAEVARTYALVRTYEVLIDQTRENVRVQERGLEIAQSRFRNGATSELDVTQATTLVESTRASLPQLEASLEQAHNALSTLLGQPTGTLDGLLEGRRAIPEAPGRITVGVPLDLLRRRPDVRSAELRAAAQGALVGVAKADLLPSLLISGTAGIQGFRSSTVSTSLFSADNLVYSIGPRIVWHFLDFGRRENSVRVEDARFQQQLLGYRNTVLEAMQEVQDAMAAFANAQQATELSLRATQSAVRSVELSLVQYREGAADYSRVLDAQRSLLAQQNSLAQARSNALTSLILLYKSLGGGWELKVGQPVIPVPVQEEMERRTDWGDLLTTPRPSELRQDVPPVGP